MYVKIYLPFINATLYCDVYVYDIHGRASW